MPVKNYPFKIILNNLIFKKFSFNLELSFGKILKKIFFEEST